MTCKDCIHNEMCYGTHTDESPTCCDFKDKSRFIELPCKVGAEIFIIIDGCEIPSYVDLGTVETVCMQDDGIWIYARYECGLTYWHKSDDLGKGYYLDAYEAEKALKERI